MSDTIYGIMQRRVGIDLGQVFTPLHLAEFAATLLDIQSGDVVLDSSAGSGSLLLTAVAHGASKVYGIEIDERVHDILQANLTTAGATFETLFCGGHTEEAHEWVKEHKDITKAMLNPPYEAKYHTFDILLNTLDALPKGAKVAIFYPAEHLVKNGQEWQDAFMAKHTVTHIVKLPKNSFQPFASVQTALFLITAGIPQGDELVFCCDITQDGLTRKKNKYREDTTGKWHDKLEPYWLDVIAKQDGDESVSMVDPKEHGLHYYKYFDTRPTDDDFRKVVEEYMGWKSGELLRRHSFPMGAPCGGMVNRGIAAQDCCLLIDANTIDVNLDASYIYSNDEEMSL